MSDELEKAIKDFSKPLFALWQNGGWGNGNNNGRGGAVDGYVLASDFSNIERKIDSEKKRLR